MIRTIGAQLRKGVAEYCVLGAVSSEPMYGWQLAETLGERGLVGGVGTLYPILTRLRDSGLVRSFMSESTTGPARRYYEITPAGTKQLGEFRREWLPFVDAVNQTVGGANVE